MDQPSTIDFLIVFNELESTDGLQYTLRGNHTDLPSTNVQYNPLPLGPDSAYKDYWFLTNLQQLLDR